MCSSDLGSFGNQQVGLTWTAPASNGGAAITDYDIRYSSDNGTNWTNVTRAASGATSATVGGLTNGTAYIFQVRAKNVAGTSGFSTSSTAVTPKAVPGIPAAPTGTPGNGQVSLSWTAPAANGTPAISDYSIQYSSNGGTTWTAFPRSPASTTTSAVPVTGLKIGRAHV